MISKTLKPVEKQSVSQQIFAQLRDNILSHQYSPGDRLPPERELCEALGVNRSSLREALKRLEQARLIEVRHGEGSTVLDFHATAGFDLLRDLVRPGGEVNGVAVRSIAEIRALIVTETARLCARRIGPPELATISELVEGIEACDPDNAEVFQDLDFKFHLAMARGSENLALLLLLNSIRDVYFEFRGFFAVMFAKVQKDPGIYREILRALAAHDEGQAAHHALCLIERTNQALLQMAGATSD